MTPLFLVSFFGLLSSLCITCVWPNKKNIKTHKSYFRKKCWQVAYLKETNHLIFNCSKCTNQFHIQNKSYVSYKCTSLWFVYLEEIEFSTCSINVKIGQPAVKAVWGLRPSQNCTTHPDRLHTFKLSRQLYKRGRSLVDKEETTTGKRAFPWLDCARLLLKGKKELGNGYWLSLFLEIYFFFKSETFTPVTICHLKMSSLKRTGMMK